MSDHLWAKYDRAVELIMTIFGFFMIVYISVGLGVGLLWPYFMYKAW